VLVLVLVLVPVLVIAGSLMWPCRSWVRLWVLVAITGDFGAPVHPERRFAPRRRSQPPQPTPAANPAL